MILKYAANVVGVQLGCHDFKLSHVNVINNNSVKYIDRCYKCNCCGLRLYAFINATKAKYIFQNVMFVEYYDKLFNYKNRSFNYNDRLTNIKVATIGKKYNMNYLIKNSCNIVNMLRACE